MGTLVNQNGDYYATSFPGSSTSRPLKRERGQEGKDPGNKIGLNATWPVKVSSLLSNWKPLQTKSNSNLPGNRLWIINDISVFAYKPKNIWGYFVTLIWPSRNAPKNVHRSKSTNLTLLEVSCIQLHAFLEISKERNTKINLPGAFQISSSLDSVAHLELNDKKMTRCISKLMS